MPSSSRKELVQIELYEANKRRGVKFLLYTGISLKELRALLAASFGPEQLQSGRVPVALKDKKKKTLYPLSLLSKKPQFFERGAYEVVFDSINDDVSRRTTVGTRRSHTASWGTREDAEALFDEGESCSSDDEDDGQSSSGESQRHSEAHSSDEQHTESEAVSEDDGVEEDPDEILRALDLSDFELPQLVNVFTQACPTGVLDRKSFGRCVEKILSQSGKYDSSTRKMFVRLFEVFDRAQTGIVDVAEFLGGLSVFTSGDRDAKIRFTFDLYDSDSDGFITVEEMTKYLTSVFLVIARTSPELFQQNQVNPVELGHVTARQCFVDSALNSDGKLSFEEFRKWYSKPGPTDLTQASAAIQVMNDRMQVDHQLPVNSYHIDELRELSGLSSLSAEDLFSMFSANCSKDGGKLSREQFKKCFFSILKKQKKKPTRELASFLDRLFSSFDVNGDNAVDFLELSSGLSILCGGSRDEKVMAAFSLFDIDGDGYITQEEMTTYLAAVFNVMYETNPEVKRSMPIDSRTLAYYTTKQAFEEADVNKDGLLSLGEFRKWYLSTGQAMVQHGAQMLASSPLPLESATRHRPVLHHQASSTPSVSYNTLKSIDFVAAITGLKERKASDIFEMIAAHVNDDGMLSRDAYNAVFQDLVESQAKESMRTPSKEAKDRLQSILDAVFASFDTDADDFVDFCELSSGLSILCEGTQQEKIKAAFALFDINQDGFISREEMETYLASVYRLVFTIDSSIATQLQITPEALAQVTTHDAFMQADANQDDRLSYEEFTKWYTTHELLPSNPTQAPVPSTSGSIRVPLLIEKESLQEMKELTNLNSYDVNDIFEFFKASASNDNTLSKSAFFRCFNKLLARNASSQPREKQEKARALLSELFELFDTDGNGVIDALELGAGLSILCGGSFEDKTQSLFTLYDADHDGFISPSEMKLFLTSVFKVLYKASPEIQEKTGLNPQQLAAATASNCFLMFDHTNNNRLNLKEFRDWFAHQNEKARSIRQSLSNVASSSSNVQKSNEKPTIIPMDVARRLSGLKELSLEKVSELFASSANEKGLISREAFDACFYKYLCAGVANEMSVEAEHSVHDVINRLFTAFDTDNNGAVDFNELTSGLSILCGGNRDQKVQAAFDLYDANRDGFISEEEMVHYLASVFKLLYALDPTREQNLGISANDLAIVTAGEIFAEADLNHDGRLNFEEFQRWYSLPQQESFNEIVAPLDLNEVRRLTNLGNLDVVEVFERFAEHADDSNQLHREAFDRCFFEIIETASHPRTEVEKLRAKVVADRIFDVFDRDGNGKIDFSELASGLSVLCKGARDSKVKAAFRLYDFNGDGYISLEEMKRYLTSIFRVLYEMQPDMQAETGVSAEELGAVTAEQAFSEADLNGDGKLSYEEFLTWYNSPSIAGISSDVAKNAVVDSSLRWMPLNEIRQLTNLAMYTPEEVFEIFATEANNEGVLSRSAFNSCFRKVICGDSKEAILKLEPLQRERIKEVVNGLFDLFDSDKSGYVDFGELASGLSVLCGGTKDQKVEAAFALFDFNGDGYISLDEMARYLTSVFRVLYQVSADTQNLGVSPEELGKVTAQQAFAEADSDNDGRLTLEEFKQWYQQPGGIGEMAKSGEQLFSIAEARRLTNLESFSPMQVFEILAECADEQGLVSREAFDNCLRRIIAERGVQPEEYKRINLILDRLFNLFDTENTGVVDFSEISSGLSVFCGGSSEERVRAAFSLYDYNGDGYISKDEMVRYLVAVFKVLKETSPSAITKVNESAEDLGRRTADQAFAEADLDGDSHLSLDEFRNWYIKSNAANIERLIEHNIPEWLSLREVRRLTNLNAHSPSEMFEVFAKFASEHGGLDRDAFRKAFEQLRVPSTDQEDDDRLRLLVDRLFDLFDSDNNNIVDFTELASGLSILCGGSQDDKVRAAFNLYDVNHDGYISLGEMRLYLTSVFKVLFEVNPDTQARMGVTAEELAEITAEQAFAEADANKDGRLSFEEFCTWYKQPSSMANQSHVPEWVSLQVVKQMTHLERYSPEEVFEIFANRCSKDGTVSRQAFEECFEELVDDEFKSDAAHMGRLKLILDRLFTIFDSDGNGVVDFCELSSGISVLCGGSREQKVRAAFALYDLNQDGFISLDEMKRYLTSVFKVLYETSPGTEQTLGVNAEELAAVTAEQCFQEADLNHDGRLSFDEFVRWYSQSAELGAAPVDPRAQASIPNVAENGSGDVADQANHTARGLLNGNLKSAGAVASTSSQDDSNHVSPASPLGVNSSGMERARQVLKLDAYEVNDLFEIFAEAAPSGELSFAAFKKCFDQIIKLAGGHSTAEERQEAELMIRRLFRAFDTDKSNTVDFGELASGLSVLSGSSMDDKVRAAFQLYDINGDGYISLDEMVNYMTSIFKVMYETSDNTRDKMGVDAEELARVTAIQCFKEADLNDDQKLSFDEFKRWCTSGL